MLIAQGERHEAVRQLNSYLETFINDPEAWLELSELYLSETDYSRAAFCFEELLLTNVRHVKNILCDNFSRKTVSFYDV